MTARDAAFVKVVSKIFSVVGMVIGFAAFVGVASKALYVAGIMAKVAVFVVVVP